MAMSAPSAAIFICTALPSTSSGVIRSSDASAWRWWSSGWNAKISRRHAAGCGSGAKMLSDWPLDRIAQVVLDLDGGQTLRQCSPLAPVLTPRERWEALAAVDGAIEPRHCSPRA